MPEDTHRSRDSCALFIFPKLEVYLMGMVERKSTVEDKKAEDMERARKLNREGSSQNPDRADDYDRRSGWKREKVERMNYEEARDQDDDEYKARRTI